MKYAKVGMILNLFGGDGKGTYGRKSSGSTPFRLKKGMYQVGGEIRMFKKRRVTQYF